MYKFIDLFCGIGGFRIALQNKGMECAFSSDIDENCRNIYYKNFGERPEGDITEISERRIPKHDVLCAGFPCQSFSISGNHNAFDDMNGRLFYEIIRIAQYHQPYVMLLENVKNIMSIDDGRVIKTIDSKLDEIGYHVHRHVLNASYFGVPQKRERVYFVCIRKDIRSNKGESLKYKKPKELYKKVYLDSILESEVDNNLYINRNDIVLYDANNTERHLKPVRIGIVNKGGQGERIYSRFGHSITLSAFGGGAGARTGLYLIGDRIRKLSILESKRLMGYKDSFDISSGINGYQQIGNSVIPSMIETVWDSIKKLMY